MSVIGPRPQLVRDMVFMTPEQRRRHTAKPGLSGLAQVNGRNAISWEDKIEWDLKYRCGQQCLAVHSLRNRPVCNFPEEKSVDRSTATVSGD